MQAEYQSHPKSRPPATPARAVGASDLSRWLLQSRGERWRRPQTDAADAARTTRRARCSGGGNMGVCVKQRAGSVGKNHLLQSARLPCDSQDPVGVIGTINQASRASCVWRRRAGASATRAREFRLVSHCPCLAWSLPGLAMKVTIYQGVSERMGQCRILK